MSFVLPIDVINYHHLEMTSTHLVVNKCVSEQVYIYYTFIIHLLLMATFR